MVIFFILFICSEMVRVFDWLTFYNKFAVSQLNGMISVACNRYCNLLLIHTRVTLVINTKQRMGLIFECDVNFLPE